MATHGIRFAEGLQVVPLKYPYDTTVDSESQHFKLENMQWLSFLVSFYANSSDSGGSTALYNIAIKSTTATGGSTAAGDYSLPFWYRLGGGIGDDNWGDITAVTTATGYVQITGESTSNMLILDVNPDVIFAHDSDATHGYVDIDITADSDTDSCIMSIVGVFEPRYPQSEQKSSTSAAT